MNEPRVTFLVDRPNWAFDYVARSIASRLSRRFSFRVEYSAQRPRLNASTTDLLYVFFWGEDWYKQFGFERHQVIKEVASYRWALEDKYGRLKAGEFAQRHLSDCNLVVTPAGNLFETLRPYCERLYLCPNGVESSLFRVGGAPPAPLRIGWVGNPEDACKGLKDILLPATSDMQHFWHTDGSWSRAKVARHYRNTHVLAIASEAESQPLPLLESMACGCFPVTTNVGIVPEFVRSGLNGIIVDRTVDAFREAFAWCENNLDHIAMAGQFNAHLSSQVRSWDACAERFAQIFDHSLRLQKGDPGTEPAPTSEMPPILTDFMDASVRDGLKFMARTVGGTTNRKTIQERLLGSSARTFLLASDWSNKQRIRFWRWPRALRNVLRRCMPAVIRRLLRDVIQAVLPSERKLPK